MLPLLTVFAGMAGAVIAALVTLYLGKRAKSGNVGTSSDATDLWAGMKDQLDRLQKIADRFEQRLDECEEREREHFRQQRKGAGQ